MIILFLSLLLASSCYGDPCARQQHEKGIVCFCNETYCDNIPSIGNLDELTLKIYYTGNNDPGFNLKDATFVSAPDPKAFIVNINNSDIHQKIIGFGAAFTDATGVSFQHLKDGAQQKLLENYFGEDGIQYSLMRVPIGANEFSSRLYTLDDWSMDDNLIYFILQYEDFVAKIPFMNKAQALRQVPIKYIASAWSAPVWMKTPAQWTGGTVLLKQYYRAFAYYMARFFEEYEKNGVKFWGVTTGNEPFSGYMPYGHVISMGWTANEQADWLNKHLAPTLKNSEAYYKDLKILIFDDGLLPLPYVVPYFLENDTLLALVDGVATHPNWDGNMAPSIRNLTISDKKDIFRISTQASHPTPSLGDWNQADDYINNIIELLTEFDYGGWMESNLALDFANHNYLGDECDAPVLVDPYTGTFMKQPTFYAIGHFSKFVIPDSVRVGISQGEDAVKSAAFLRPDGLKVVVLYNTHDENMSVQIEDGGRYSTTLDLASKTINTILYKA